VFSLSLELWSCISFLLLNLTLSFPPLGVYLLEGQYNEQVAMNIACWFFFITPCILSFLRREIDGQLTFMDSDFLCIRNFGQKFSLTSRNWKRHSKKTVIPPRLC
jgi:uncharacterized membrane protein YqaE (UPF0057 family)